ncbi:Branched-chain amino acid transport system II carrier protein [Actinomyces succiniciruminis]|uniref:Branched-chain amino acid transport system II carrier protein n=1 Tax=Actinomyces succiniciruminis TaxID=1522002 RepID=A0A1L7RPM9_9ACTO|nr:branched-chain amino acid transport system II carrier protein [Actinomyces succiniciruminis]CED91478.1 Branched-chain amino acid transport system II carrier protein [Actinomyces succiniciruminis]
MLERTAAPAPATVNTARPTPGGGAGPATIATTGLMLFALFFGAGNMVFPPVLGASAGAHLPAVLVGFLATGVVAPLAAVVAVSTSGEGIVGLARRVGPRFGALMPLAVYLSIGPLYAVPRVATVSYELAIRPLLGLAGVDAGHWALPAHAAVFFTASVAVAARPSHLADAIGRWLTPALLALIAVLCTVVVASQPVVTRPAAPDYTAAPVATGLTRGYLTMDVLAATVFGIVVITTLHGRGLRTPRAVVRATAASGALAAGLLAAVYVGLALIGERTPGAADDGTALLRAAAARALGNWGG